MKTSRPIFSVPVKTLAIILSVICVFVSAAGLLYGILLYDDGYDSENGETQFYESSLVSRRVSQVIYTEITEAIYQYYEFGLNDSGLLDRTKTNLRFDIYKITNSGLNQRVPISTYAQEEYGFHTHEDIYLYLGDEEVDGQGDQMFRVDAYLVSPLKVKDQFYQMEQFYGQITPYGNTPLWIAGGAVLLWLLLQIYLICAAGHKRSPEGMDEIVQGGLHRIPFDVLSVIYIPILMGFILTWDELERNFEFGRYTLSLEYFVQGALLLGAFAVMVYLTLLIWTMSLAIRIKKENLFKDMVLIRVLRWMITHIRRFFHELPYVWKGILVVGLITLVLGISILAQAYGIAAVLLLCTAGLAVEELVRQSDSRRQRQEAVARLAEGNLQMPLDVKTYTKEDAGEIQNLSRIQDTVSLAVEKQLSSERMKTELITNVSHDIKTPLTSIINYVDLLQKEGPYNEKQTEYLAVLQKQSVRMRKLIEDLIEASKAATGNVTMEIMPISLGEMIRQLQGEYAVRFEEAGLELKVGAVEDITVLADGRLLSRVFDNLLVNALKYSMPGTRVYLDVGQGAAYATVSLRNISKEPLNISEEELMERFVRGDSSRHTEGSGLGLSIAKSLTEMMGGMFKIAIDADLFKANLSLKKDNA